MVWNKLYYKGVTYKMQLVDIKRVGVLGAGTMGAGIAQIAAEAGFEVVLRDIEDRFVEKGMDTIKKNVQRGVEKGKLNAPDAEVILSRLHPTTKLEDLGTVDFVFEAVIEKMDLKKEVYSTIDKICPPEAVFASNTSGLSITEIASATARPAQVIGMHFFNPVPVLKLVEVIKGAKTDEGVFNLALEMARKLGKDPIAVNEAPLFVVNRILCPMINEAIFVLQEGIASAEDIDKGMRLGCNHPIGPLALADLVGLDVLLLVEDTLYQETGDSKYRACPLLRKMVRAGKLGRKTGEGFYKYA